MSTWGEGNEKELYMLENPSEWPMWPRLPLKRRVEVGGEPFEGYLKSTEFPIWNAEVQPRVYIRNVYNEDRTSPETKEYSTLQAILDDGWVVD